MELPNTFPSRAQASGTFSPLLASSFVRKLYFLVSAAEHKHIIGWVRDGAAFEVRCPKLFETEILPRFFRHSRFQSFVRQLNFYAFKKISRERSCWVYSHEYFQRDKPELLDMLRRKTYNNGGERAANAGIMTTGLAASRKRAHGAMAASPAVGGGEYYSHYEGDGTDAAAEQQQQQQQQQPLPQPQMSWDYDAGGVHTVQVGYDAGSIHDDDGEESEIEDGAFTHDRNHSWKNSVRFFDCGRDGSNGNTSGSERDDNTVASSMHTSVEALETEEVVTTTIATSTVKQEDKDKDKDKKEDDEQDSSVPADNKSVSDSTDGGEISRSPTGPDSPWSHLSDSQVRTAQNAFQTTLKDDSDSDMSSTAKVVLFCLNNDPFVQPMKLQPLVQEFLRKDDEVAAELEEYAQHLAPSPTMSRSESHMSLSSVASSVSQSDCGPNILRANEVTVMRTFLQFAVTKLQEAARESESNKSVVKLDVDDVGAPGMDDTEEEVIRSQENLKFFPAVSSGCVTQTVHHCAERWWSFSSMYA